jgi:hypothetical protein
MEQLYTRCRRYDTHLRSILLIIVTALFVAGTALAAGERIPRSAMTGGGGTQSTASVQLRAVVGQPIAGASHSTVRLCSGLFCGTSVPDDPDTPVSTLYVPLVVR